MTNGGICETVDDCSGYPAENKLCIHDILQLINTPGGYCTSCCNEPGEDICAENIDCVGVTNALLICVAQCETDADCRQDEAYECRELYYIPEEFPRKYCLPNEDHLTPDPAYADEEVVCPWPWT